jgi:hypothetical protein
MPDRLQRSPKSGSEWTWNELICYNIVVRPTDAQAFFGTQLPLPEPQIAPEILSTEHAQDMVDWHHSYLINLLDLANAPIGSTESRVDDFAANLLLNIGYVSRTRVAQTRTDLPLLMCGTMVHAQTDVCVVDREANDILLLVQEDKRLAGNLDAEPQLIAKALAAFQYNNLRRKLAGRPALVNKVCRPLPFPTLSADM